MNNVLSLPLGVGLFFCAFLTIKMIYLVIGGIEYMNVSYNNEELLEEVCQDMLEFGEELGVIAIYSIFPEDPDKYYITDYIWGEPVHDSDMDIYKEEFEIHKKELETIKFTKHEEMTIRQLYNRLLEQMH